MVTVATIIGTTIISNDNNNNNNNDNHNSNHPKYIAPKPGEPQKREWKGITLYWCAKCKAWQRHNTNQHMDPEENTIINIQSCNSNELSSSASTAATGSTKPNTVSTVDNSNTSTLTDDKDPLVTFASTFQRWKRK